MPIPKHTAIIIDDEPDAIAQLKKLLTEHPQIKVVETFQSTDKALISILKNKPGLLFLDVEMPGQDGIDFLKDLQQIENPPTVVMVTAFESYMLEAFRNHAFDYLLKPVGREELKKVIERFENQQSKQNIKGLLSELGNKIRIPGVYETWFLSPGQIFYLQADGRYTDIILTDGKQIKTSINLGKLDEMLPDKTFKRISKSNIINASYLQKLDHRKKACVLQVGEKKVELGFSRRYIN